MDNSNNLQGLDASFQEDFPGNYNYNDRDAILQQPSTTVSEERHDSIIAIKDITSSRQTTPRRNYSVMRARVVSSLVLIFYAMGSPSTTVTSQYLRHRWLSEAQLNDSDLANRTVCGTKNHSDPLVGQEDDVEARVSILTMYLSYSVAIPAIFSSLILGSYSDILGRRLVLIMPLLGALINVTLSFFIMRFDLEINLFYIAKILDGLSGSFYCFLIAAFSITADLDIGKSRRTIWIVVLEGVARVTMSSSSVVTGILIQQFDYSVAILFLVGPEAVALFLALFLMPETKPEVTERQRYNPCIHIKRIFRMYVSDGNSRDRKALFLALILFFLVVFTSLQDSITTLYQLHEPFCWDSTLIGYYGAVSNVAQVTVGTIFLKVLQALHFIRNDVIAMISTLFQVGGCVMEAVITTTWEFFLVPVVTGPFFVSAGVLRAVMSFLVGPENQGAMFASVAVVETLCTTMSATVLSQVYSATVSTLPGLVYLIIAGFALVTFFIYFIFFHYYDDPVKKRSLQLQVQGTSSEDLLDEGSKSSSVPYRS